MFSGADVFYLGRLSLRPAEKTDIAVSNRRNIPGRGNHRPAPDLVFSVRICGVGCTVAHNRPKHVYDAPVSMLTYSVLWVSPPGVSQRNMPKLGSQWNNRARVGRNKRSALRRKDIERTGTTSCVGGAGHSRATRRRQRKLGGRVRAIASGYAALARPTRRRAGHILNAPVIIAIK